MLKGIDLDVFLLVSIYKAARSGKSITTWKLANDYNWPDKERFLFPAEKWQFYHSKSVLISKRLESMARDGFIRVEKNNNERRYVLLGKNLIKRHKFNDGYKDSFQFKNKEKWIIIEI